MPNIDRNYRFFEDLFRDAEYVCIKLTPVTLIKIADLIDNTSDEDRKFLKDRIKHVILYETDDVRVQDLNIQDSI